MSTSTWVAIGLGLWIAVDAVIVGAIWWQGRDDFWVEELRDLRDLARSA